MDDIKNTIKELRNGVLQDTTTGRFVPGATPKTAITTSARGRELAQRRTEKAQDAMRAAVTEKIKTLADVPINNSEEAYAFIVAAQAAVLQASEKPHFDDVVRLGELLGLVSRKEELLSSVSFNLLQPDVMSMIHELADFAEALQGDVIEAEAI